MSPILDDNERYLRALLDDSIEDAGEIEQQFSGLGMAEILRGINRKAEFEKLQLVLADSPRRASSPDMADAMRYTFMSTPKPRWQAGIRFRWGSAWIGAHWSPTNKRLCVNLLPFITIWVCPPGGVAP